MYVDRALERMAKKALRHYSKLDEFCLTFDERIRIQEGLARLAILNELFEQQLNENFRFVADALRIDVSMLDEVSTNGRLRRVLERFLFERGEAFVESLRAGQEMLFVGEEVEQNAKADVLAHPETSSARAEMVRLVSETLERTLRMPSPETQQYLRAVSDGYTLMAFLRETPDVQSAVSKLFSRGEIWLDTTAVLPILAEVLLDESDRGYSRLLYAAHEAGVVFHISLGVLEEINAHMDISLQAWRSPLTWNSRTPFLLSSYIWSGRPVDGFPKWMENFRGRARPVEDLSDYLLTEKSIRVTDLASACTSVAEALRWHTIAYWEEVHEGRTQLAATTRKTSSEFWECEVVEETVESSDTTHGG